MGLKRFICFFICLYLFELTKKSIHFHTHTHIVLIKFVDARRGNGKWEIEPRREENKGSLVGKSDPRIELKDENNLKRKTKQ